MVSVDQPPSFSCWATLPLPLFCAEHWPSDRSSWAVNSTRLSPVTTASLTLKAVYVFVGGLSMYCVAKAPDRRIREGTSVALAKAMNGG